MEKKGGKGKEVQFHHLLLSNLSTVSVVHVLETRCFHFIVHVSFQLFLGCLLALIKCTLKNTFTEVSVFFYCDK